MNVEQTQPTLVLAAEVAGLMALQQQAADQTQRQQALSSAREAAHAEASIAQASSSAESAPVGERGPDAGTEGPGPRRLRGQKPAKDPAIKDAPNIGPLGHRLDIIA